MKLTKNERKVLMFLLKDGKMTDSKIASKLKISSQAVGKIRKKLEKEVINSYTIKLDYSKLGIQIFAICLSKITREGMEKGELEVEELLKKTDNLIHVYRLPNSNYTHVMIYGFRDIDELDSFFHSPKNKKALHCFIENREIFTFSHNSLVLDDPTPLFIKMIEEIDSTKGTELIKEIERFKKRVEN